MFLFKNYSKIFICLSLLTLIIISTPTFIHATGCPDSTNASCTQSGGSSFDNPLGNNSLSPNQLYGRLIFAFMGVTGSVALVVFVYGGFVWMTAAGNETKIKKGKDTLMWAVLGLFVIFASYAILRAVFETLQLAGS